MRKLISFTTFCLLIAATWLTGQETVLVRPREIDDVLVNPGIGFMTFQRFNGDTLNAGSRWTEGFPIVYQDFDGDLTNEDHPATSLVYWRVYWRYIHPAPDSIDFAQFDRVFETAAARGQTVILRIAPYGGGDDKDVPDWYRELVGEEPELPRKWRTHPENPLYLEHFGGLIRALGARYDGHPDLEAVDVSLVGFWGEGSGSHEVDPHIWRQLVYCYLDGFKKSHLIFQPLNGDAPDPGLMVRGLPIAAYWPGGRNNGEGPRMRHLGWRLDCLGDMGFWREDRGDWCHMLDIYPQQIVTSGMKDAWKKAPVSLEICGTFRSWKNRQQYDEEVVKYVFDQALKWHISSFNAKSSPVPKEWQPLVDEWLKKMGYRFVLRKFTFPSAIRPHGQIAFATWWENKGVAPCYHPFPFAIRLKNSAHSEILLTDADIREWLPGDIVYDSEVYLPADMPEGTYDFAIAILDPRTREPNIRFAIEGRGADGWYSLGKIAVSRDAGHRGRDPNRVP
ncbi:MAG: DUF4832 domain-containing protein [Candidatus Glassbacteria bacterium]|nr:DUF4832 domain-containing protein [Candidatus Glassbacteria bacterium]